jgi:hypothetical protein
VLPAAVQGFPTGVLALCDVCADGIVLAIGLAMDEVCQVETEILASTPEFFLVLNKKIGSLQIPVDSFSEPPGGGRMATLT